MHRGSEQRAILRHLRVLREVVVSLGAIPDALRRRDLRRRPLHLQVHRPRLVQRDRHVDAVRPEVHDRGALVVPVDEVRRGGLARRRVQQHHRGRRREVILRGRHHPQIVAPDPREVGDVDAERRVGGGDVDGPRVERAVAPRAVADGFRGRDVVTLAGRGVYLDAVSLGRGQPPNDARSVEQREEADVPRRHVRGRVRPEAGV